MTTDNTESIFVTRIREDVAQLKQAAKEHGRMPELVRLAIENAEQWLASGGFSRYSCEDFDVSQRLRAAAREFDRFHVEFHPATRS